MVNEAEKSSLSFIENGPYKFLTHKKNYFAFVKYGILSKKHADTVVFPAIANEN